MMEVQLVGRVDQWEVVGSDGNNTRADDRPQLLNDNLVNDCSVVASSILTQRESPFTFGALCFPTSRCELPKAIEKDDFEPETIVCASP